MRASLKFPPVSFNAVQIQSIGRGFATIIDRFEMIIYACAIMPDHVHVVFGRHDAIVEYLVGVLKRAASRQLNAEGLHPLRGYARSNGQTPSPWTDGGWVRYLNTPDEVIDAIGYVNDNPLKIRMPRQSWDFVRAFR